MPDAIYEWLTQSEARDHLAFASGELKNGRKEIAVQKKLRETLSADYVRALFRLLSLRERAKQKFPESDQMFFTDESLQQSSSLRLAEVKAQRFPANSCIEDWCCGIGGDLLGLVQVSNNVTGFDLNAEIAHYAKTNLRTKVSHASVEVADVGDREVSSTRFYHVDPARRQNGRRTTQLEHYQPGIDVLQKVVFDSLGAGIKLAPATKLYDSWNDRCEWQWIGHQGECKQLVCWAGELARNQGRRSALVVGAETEHELVELPSNERPTLASSQVASHLYEPHSCLTVSDLVSTLAAKYDFRLLSSTPCFVTADLPIQTPFTQGFEILESLPASESKIMTALKRRMPSDVEFKCRVPFDHFARLKKKLRKGDGPPLTLIAMELNQRNIAFLCRRLPRTIEATDRNTG